MPIFAALQQRTGSLMLHYLEANDRCVEEWRAIVSAWVVAIVLVVLFASAEAVASRPEPSPPVSMLVGAEIPRHDSGLPGPDEVAAADLLERARAEAYSCW
jgi:hypothetical protein